MKKLLVADFMGDLVPIQHYFANYSYDCKQNTIFNSLDESNPMYIDYLANVYYQSLEPYLQQGNDLAIVTDKGNSSYYDFYSKYITKLLSVFGKYKNQIKLFVIGDRRDLYNCGEYGSLRYSGNDISLIIQDTCLCLIDDKSEVFNHIDIRDKQVYIVGYDTCDMGMLVDGFNRGSSTSIIDYNLGSPTFLKDSNGTNELIKKLVSNEINILVNNCNPDLHVEGANERRKNLFKSYYASYFPEKCMAYQSYLSSEDATIYDIYKLNHLYNLIAEYNDNLYSGDKFQITNKQYIDDFVTNTEVYSSFNEYKNKVLMKI